MSDAGAPGNAGTGAAGVEAGARVIGHYAWLEERLFEALGGWVATVAEPEVKLALLAESHHHAWHSRLWADLLPDLPGPAPTELVAPATPELAVLMGDVAALEGSVERLTAVHRVLSPRLVARYTLHLQSTSRVSEGPLARVLELVLADELRDGRAGELLLQGLLATPEDVARAGRCQVEVESRLVGAGGLGAGGLGGREGLAGAGRLGGDSGTAHGATATPDPRPATGGPAPGSATRRRGSGRNS